MTGYLAIDPGPKESAYVVIDDECRPVEFAKLENETLRVRLQGLAASCHHGAIEMVASYGMSVGADVFETVYWTGRFCERSGNSLQRVFRLAVKMHHCNSAKAKDSNIAQALIDRFASGVPNKGKGTKASPGWFYGFAGDVWAAYALAVYVADQDSGFQL